MKKLLIVLLALVTAAPAMAVVTITGSSPANYQTTIGYNSTAETKLVRSFALNITVDNGAKITAISGFKTDGVSTAASKGYGIYPGTIDINSTTGVVKSYATPVAKAGSAGALGGLGTSGLTVELGSLYNGDANKPGTTGNLFTITVDKACNFTVAAEPTRGGVVFEDATSAAITGGPFAVGPPPAVMLDGTVTLKDLIAGKEVGKVITTKIYTAGTGTLLETLSITLGSGGVYGGVVTARTPGTYDICFKGSHWLSKKVTVTLVSGDNMVNTVSLLNGDVNGDDAITSADLGIIKTNYLKTGASGDLNEDGAVTSIDLGIIKFNYLKSGDCSSIF